MPFTRAVASTVVTLVIAGAAISPAAAAKLHQTRAYPGVTTALSTSTISPGGADAGNAGDGGAGAAGSAGAAARVRVSGDRWPQPQGGPAA